MESIINKIIEIDRMADSRIVEAEGNSRKIIADAEKTCKDLKIKLAADADKRIGEVEKINNNDYNTRILELKDKYSAEKKEMDSFYKSRHIEIENAIFAEIVGEKIEIC